MNRAEVLREYLKSEFGIETIEQIEEDLGLNKNIFVRYGEYMLNLLQGDLGTSYYSDERVFDKYIERLPATLELAVAFIVVALVFSLPLGILAAIKQYSIFDRIASFVANSKKCSQAIRRKNSRY